METLWWIILSGIGMSLIALVGVVFCFFKEKRIRGLMLPLVAFSSGALLGGAFLHLIPEAMELASGGGMFLWILSGFSLFFLMEQFLHWHHCHKMPSEHKHPVTYLILLADGLHNFIGGLAIAGSFMISVKTGMVTWLVCAFHEIPQELGDFGVLVHGGWEAKKALVYNFLSALTIIPAGLIVYFFSSSIDMTFLLPFAAGNFIYIAASDLIPEVKHSETLKKGLLHFAAFVAGIALIALTTGH